MKEIWKDIKEYEGYYQVSNLGNIKSLDRYVKQSSKSGNAKQMMKGTILRQRKHATHGDKENGYYIVNLFKNHKGKTFLVHRLVADAFIEKPSYAECVNHIDGNKQNNNVNNLEWCTYSHNNKEAYRLGLKSFTEKNKIAFEKNKRKVAMFDKNNNLIHTEDCSISMALYLKEKENLSTNIKTIARNIREICHQYELKNKKIEILSSKKRKSCYGYIFKYY